MPDATTILAAVLLAVVPSLVYLAILNAIDRYEKEPWTILLACLGVGALVAPALSLAILVLAGRSAVLPPAFAPGPQPDALVGIVESLVLGVLLIVLVHSVRDEFDDVLDGVIYGAALGAGFGATESFLYVLGGTSTLEPATDRPARHRRPEPRLLHGGLRSHPGLGAGPADRPAQRGHRPRPGDRDVAQRLPRHPAGDPVARAVAARRRLGMLARLVAELINWLGIFTLVVIVVLAWRREARILHAELRDEVADGLVPEADYATITSFRGRLGRQWRLLRTQGMGSVTAPATPVRGRRGARLPQVAHDPPAPEAPAGRARGRAASRDPPPRRSCPGGNRDEAPGASSASAAPHRRRPRRGPVRGRSARPPPLRAGGARAAAVGRQLRPVPPPARDRHRHARATRSARARRSRRGPS